MREQILNDLKTAMKNKDKERLAVIRLVKGSMQMAELDKGHELSDDEVMDVISKEIKSRKDSIAEFEKGNREDLVKQATDEIKILEEYLPKPFSSAEIMKIIDEVFDEVKPTSNKEMGKVMKELTPKLKNRADMSEVSKIVKEKINKVGECTEICVNEKFPRLR